MANTMVKYALLNVGLGDHPLFAGLVGILVEFANKLEEGYL